MGPREKVYDEQIAPLMTQIIEVCKANKIPMLADFCLACEEDEGLKCTTVLLDKSWEPGPEMFAAHDALLPKRRPMTMITVTKGDGSKEITAIV